MTIAPNRYRSLFISDTHLGSRHCQADRLFCFLKNNDADRIYLVGDIIDFKFSNWPMLHRDCFNLFIDKAIAGTKIIYIPGNHDHIFRNHLGVYGNLEINNITYHQLVDGQWYLVTHGDETDMWGLGFCLGLILRVERLSPMSFWEIIRKVLKTWMGWHTKHFEDKMRKIAKGYAGVICGHVHFPRVTVGYLNCGDWVHHCTAIAEHYDGRFELLQG